MFAFQKKIRKYFTHKGKSISFNPLLLILLQKNYYICLKKCYNSLDPLVFNKNQISKLESCKTDCKAVLKDLKTFFANINYLSEVKNTF